MISLNLKFNENQYYYIYKLLCTEAALKHAQLLVYVVNYFFTKFDFN